MLLKIIFIILINFME